VLIDTGLDELRENYCLAMVPHNGQITRQRLLEIEGCLGVRPRGDALHAVFAVEPERSRALLGRELGIEDGRCTRIALEEMFVELAGGQDREQQAER